MSSASPKPSSGLRFGPLGGGAVHLCIDMQLVFAEPTPWHTPWMGRVLPLVVEIAERQAARTVFTRFIPPAQPGDSRVGVSPSAVGTGMAELRPRPCRPQKRDEQGEIRWLEN